MSEQKQIANVNEFLENRKINLKIKNDEHRLEFVAEINGATYVNDSSSVTVFATKYSLETIEAPIVLITGGLDKNSDYSVLSNITKGKIRAIIYLGKSNERILQYFYKASLLFVGANSIEESVKIGNAYAKSGDIVLFSPACPDYNDFDIYKRRGVDFKRLVIAINSKNN